MLLVFLWTVMATRDFEKIDLANWANAGVIHFD